MRGQRVIDLTDDRATGSARPAAPIRQAAGDRRRSSAARRWFSKRCKVSGDFPSGDPAPFTLTPVGTHVTSRVFRALRQRPYHFRTASLAEKVELTDQPFSSTRTGSHPVPWGWPSMFSGEKMVITPTCIVWVIVFAHDTRATAPEVPSMDIGEICQRIDAEHPLAKRSTHAALLGGCQLPPGRRPRIAALLRAPQSPPSETDGGDLGAGVPAPGFDRTRSSQGADLPLRSGAGEPHHA